MHDVSFQLSILECFEYCRGSLVGVSEQRTIPQDLLFLLYEDPPYNKLCPLVLPTYIFHLELERIYKS